MNSKLAILFSLVLASGTALAGGEYDQSTGDQSAMDQGVDQSVNEGAADQSGANPGMGGTAEQQQSPEASFSQVDANADGLISEDEAQGSQQLTDNFDQVDANGDGYVNQSEYDSLLGEQTLQE